MRLERRDLRALRPSFTQGATTEKRGIGTPPDVDLENVIGMGRVKRPIRRSDILPYTLVAPLVLFIIGLALVPAAFTIVESFFKVQPLNPPRKFIGLANFVNLFRDTAVLSSIENTALYVIIGVTASTVLGIALAVTLQKKFVGRSILIAVLILPWALPGVVEGIVWTGIWDSNVGLLNSLLTTAHLITHYQVFLGQNQLVTILAIGLVQVWQITPLSALLILAALQNIPQDIYEAASIDGCSAWSSFRSHWCRRLSLP
jgi:multiple sugar transport system permease protein